MRLSKNDDNLNPFLQPNTSTPRIHIELFTQERSIGYMQASQSQTKRNRKIDLGDRIISHRSHDINSTHVIGLALALRLVIRRSAKRAIGAAARRCAVVAHSIAPIVVPESGRDRELVWRDERDVCARAAPRACRVDERRFKQRAVFAVESACAGLEIGDCSCQWAVARVRPPGRQDSSTLDQIWLVFSVSVITRLVLGKVRLTVPNPQRLSKVTVWVSPCTPNAATNARATTETIDLAENMATR